MDRAEGSQTDFWQRNVWQENNHAMRMAVKPPDAIFLDFFHGSNFLGVKGSNPQQLAFLFAKLFLWAMPKKKRSSMPPAAGYRLWLEEADFGPTFFQRVSFA